MISVIIARAERDNQVRDAIRAFESYPASVRNRLLGDYCHAGAPWGAAWIDAAQFAALAPQEEFERVFAPYGGAL